MINVLVLEDDLVDQMALTRLFDKKVPQAKVTVSSNISVAQKQLDAHVFNWVISDFNLPDGTILDIIQYAPSTKMICVSGELEEEKINELITAGLYKYLLKDQHLNYLTYILREIENEGKYEQVNTPTSQNNLKDLMEPLNRHFEEDDEAKIEILEIFLDQIVQVEIPLLLNSIQHQEIKKLKHLAHKIQSSFRLFSATTVIATLIELENFASATPIPWDKINAMRAELNTEFANYQIKVKSILALLKSKKK